MEYFRQRHNQIQASFALRAGNLLTHYSSLTATLPSDQKYDATLTVCVLQALLTNCHELLSGMRKNQKDFFREPLSDLSSPWGLTRSFITKYTFPKELTLETVIEHLRNALSHPTFSEDDQFPATGYTTLRHPSNLVSAFRFTDSPWVVTKGERRWDVSSKKIETVKKKVAQFHEKFSCPGLLTVRRESDGAFGIFHEGEMFLPICVIELPLEAMIDLVKSLANHLAQPTDSQWDGKTIHRLVAA